MALHGRVNLFVYSFLIISCNLFFLGILPFFFKAVHVSVINIIGIDNKTKTLYGIGNNKKSYMKYSPDKEKWFSVAPEMWDKIWLTLNDTIKIEDGYENESKPEAKKQQNMGNGVIWGG